MRRLLLFKEKAAFVLSLKIVGETESGILGTNRGSHDILGLIFIQINPEYTVKNG